MKVVFFFFLALFSGIFFHTESAVALDQKFPLTLKSGSALAPARSGVDVRLPNQNLYLIPPAELDAPAREAEAWLEAARPGHVLEGAIFDPSGNLIFCDVTEKKVLRANPDKTISTVVQLQDLAPGGLALHKDGRLFMAGLDLINKKGAVLALSPHTGKIEEIVPVAAGYLPNDLVFDANGGFYFSDFKGSSTNPAGGVYYVSPDFKTITPVIPNMAQANGVALSPDGKFLWATEFAANRLHRAELDRPASVAYVGSTIPYHFMGPAPDSMRVDSAGNVYVALYGQGRVLMLNGNGAPVGQILLPGREAGHNTLSTSLAIDPASQNLYIVSCDAAGDGNSTVFKGEALANGQKPANAQ